MNLVALLFFLPFAKSNNSIETKLVAGPSRHRPTGPQGLGPMYPSPIFTTEKKTLHKWRLRLHAAQEAALTFCAKISTEANNTSRTSTSSVATILNHFQTITLKLLEACVDDTKSCELSNEAWALPLLLQRTVLDQEQTGIYLPIPSLPNNPSSLV
ncbi:hypothetical protein BGY98DRAFT_932150 [Russula aff. rugulosa BPL654]|nr:hypothetical protein BGY98DRAFT_932150 [Russula aff. rugulosa BPL654]